VQNLSYRSSTVSVTCELMADCGHKVMP